MNYTEGNEHEASFGELLVHKELLPSVISSLRGSSDIPTLVKNIKVAVKFLNVLSIELIEDEILQYLMPIMVQTLDNVYNENNLKAKCNENGIASLLKYNIEVAVNLVEASRMILEFVTKCEILRLRQIKSIPLNLAKIIQSTFQHCKSSQKNYESHFDSVSEILTLFRKTQELHAKFLIFLESQVIFDFLTDNEIEILQNVLNLLCHVGGELSGMNVKSMADNWKGFAALTQKYYEVLNSNSFNLSVPFKVLTEEIKYNLQTIIEVGFEDLKKATQHLKIVGFLIKVIFRLAENYQISDYFDDIIDLCSVVQNYPCGYFQTCNFSEEFINSFETAFISNNDFLVSMCYQENSFLEKVCSLDNNYVTKVKNIFGFLIFLNDFLKRLSELSRGKSEQLKHFKLAQFLNLIFTCTSKCYQEFFWDYNSVFYEDLITNIAVAVFLYPNQYKDVERILLKYVIQNHIWTAMIAIDSWCLIFRHTSVNTSTTTLHALIAKIEELKLGKFTDLPNIIFLKTLVQRIFKILPDSARNEIVSRYRPIDNLFVWKTLNMKNILLSQRFQIEFVLSDLFEKLDMIEKGNFSTSDYVSLAENLEIFSDVNFNSLEINISRLAPYVNRLWSFSSKDLSPANNFSTYFLYKLTKITKAIVPELVGEDLLLVLNQLKPLLINPLFKFLICDILHLISRRNFNNFKEKVTLLSLIKDIFQIILTDKNSIVIEIGLETLQEISNNSSFELVVNNIITSSPALQKQVTNFTQRTFSKIKYNTEYLESIKSVSFHHSCLEWTSAELPPSKRIKVGNESGKELSITTRNNIESDIDGIINEIKNSVEKLSEAKSRTSLHYRQKASLKHVINKLDYIIT